MKKFFGSALLLALLSTPACTTIKKKLTGEPEGELCCQTDQTCRDTYDADGSGKISQKHCNACGGSVVDADGKTRKGDDFEQLSAVTFCKASDSDDKTACLSPADKKGHGQVCNVKKGCGNPLLKCQWQAGEGGTCRYANCGPNTTLDSIGYCRCKNGFKSVGKCATRNAALECVPN